MLENEKNDIKIDNSTDKSAFVRTNQLKGQSVLTIKEKILINIIRKISRGIDYLILIISFIILFIGAYSIWDTYQVQEIASTEEYEIYKPDKSNSLSYEKLVKLNNEVIGWIDIYGTKVDYPIVQANDNDKYLNTTVFGEFSTAGSIFLDCRNKKDFSDLSNIVYGHYMAERKMFGDLERFNDKDFFDSHKFGLLHRNSLPDMGITFLAFIKTQGTDSIILSPIKDNFNAKKNLIDYIYKKATFSRKLDIKENQSLVVLDTCDFSITNGRRVLVGVLTEKVEKNIFKNVMANKKYYLSKWLKNFVVNTNLLLVLFIIWLILIIFYILLLILEKVRKEKNNEY